MQMRKKFFSLVSYIIIILISVLSTAYAKSDLFLTMPLLLAASNSIDRIAGCYSGNFTDNCLGYNVNGVKGVLFEF
ncbi:MAG TPA: hypothetical protein DDY20_12385 [Desulfobulbaceae bacterium]|nr:hypothetical protein [Desulfobulbaceae bacterium]